MTSLSKRWGVWGLAGLGALLGLGLVYVWLGNIGLGSGHDPADVESDLRQISSSSNLRLWYLGSSFGGWHVQDVAVTLDDAEVPGDTTVDPGQEVHITYGDRCVSETCGVFVDVWVHRVGTGADSAVCLDGAAEDEQLRDAARALRPVELSGVSLPPATAPTRVSFRECTLIH